jgi:WD40 repeat protein
MPSASVSSLNAIQALKLQSIEGIDACMKGARDLCYDARRFILAHREPIELAPLQGYVSALLFSPSRSLIRRIHQEGDKDHILFRFPEAEDWSDLVQTLSGHQHSIHTLDFSPDGNWLASGAADLTIKIWDTSTGECIQTISDIRQLFWSVRYSPDGKTIATASSDATVRVWDPLTATCLRSLHVDRAGVNCLAYSPDGLQIIFGSNYGTGGIWDLSKDEVVHTLGGYEDAVVAAIAISSTGKMITSGPESRTCRIWNVATGSCMWSFKAHNSPVASVVFSKSDELVATSAYETEVKVWNTTTGQLLHILGGVKNRKKPLQFIDDQRLASCGSDGSIHVWDCSTGACVKRLHGQVGDIHATSFCNSKQWLACCSKSIIQIWDMGAQARDVRWAAEKHTLRVNEVAIHPDEKRLASCSDDDTIKVWSTSTGECTTVISEIGVQCCDYSNDDLILSGSRAGNLRLWNADTGALIKEFDGANNEIATVALSADGLHAAAGYGYNISVWEISSGSLTDSWQVNPRLDGESSPSGDSSGDELERQDSSMEASEYFSSEIASSGEDQSISSKNGQETLSAKDQATSSGESQGLPVATIYFTGIMKVAFSADGSKVGAATRRSMMIWKLGAQTCHDSLVVGRERCSTTEEIKPGLWSSLGRDFVPRKIIYGPLMERMRDMVVKALKEERCCYGMHLPSILNFHWHQENREVSEDENYRGYGISPDRRWVMKAGKRLVWLPAETLGATLAIRGTTLAFGCFGGQVLVLRFPQCEAVKI